MKQDRRIPRTKSSLRKAFLELADEKPIEKISVRELCERANINRTCFYDHYVDYPAFLAAFEESIAEEMLMQLKGILHHTDPPIVTMQHFLSFLKTNTYTKFLLSDSGKTVFGAMLKKVIFQDWFENNKTLASDMADYLFQYVINGGFSVIELWYEKGFQEPVEEMAELILTSHIGALSPFSVLSYVVQTPEDIDA